MWNKTYHTKVGSKTGRVYQWFVLKQKLGEADVQVIVDEGEGHYPPEKKYCAPPVECESRYPYSMIHPYHPSQTGIVISMNGTAELKAGDLVKMMTQIEQCKTELKVRRDGFKSNA